MSDQPSPRIDHVGLSVLSDFDLGYHLSDQLEIYLGDADPDVPAHTGDRQCHVWLCLLPKVDRPVITLVSHGGQKLRFLGQVLSAVDSARRKSGHKEPLMSGRIEPGYLGDRRDEAKQAQSLDPLRLESAV